ncbi:MAG: DUF72 domain-containing protein [Chloroflexota bacterium]|nr:DUF72 domain-containing protein [Chloroflexota bacterium]
MASLNIGTSSWQFDDWRGVFYPEGLPKTQQLPYYTQQFNSVEVNTSFYGLPKPSTLVNWLETVPPGFTFALKFPQVISHQKRLTECEPETLAFLDVLRSLGPAAAPGFLQLPPDFTRQRYGRTLATYLDWLATQLDGLRISVEVRAADLMTPAFAQFVGERGMALVLVDRVGTPDLFTAWTALTQSAKAPAFVHIRWIGDDKNGPKGDGELVAPRDEQLDIWAQRLADSWHASLDIYGYMHNPYEGHSPASIRRLHARLAARMPLPAWPPVTTAPESPGQMALF